MFRNAQLESKEYQPPLLTDDQMRELEDAIWVSPDAEESVKPLIIWMLRQTEGFVVSVALSLMVSEHGEQFVRDFMNASHDMVSCNGSTRIDSFSKKFSTEMRIRSHGGCFMQ